MTDLSHHLARRLDRIRTIPGGHGVTSRGRRFALAGLLASLVLGCTTASRQAPRDQRPRSVGSPTLELSAQPVAAPGAGYARELSSTFQAVSEEVGPAVVSVRAFSRIACSAACSASANLRKFLCTSDSGSSALFICL